MSNGTWDGHDRRSDHDRRGRDDLFQGTGQVTFDPLTGILRVLNDEGENLDSKPFKAVITVVIDEYLATLEGALDKLTKKDMAGIRDILALAGIKKIRMKRAYGRRLHTGFIVGETDGYTIWETKRYPPSHGWERGEKCLPSPACGRGENVST